MWPSLFSLPVLHYSAPLLRRRGTNYLRECSWKRMASKRQAAADLQKLRLYFFPAELFVF